MKTNFPTTQRFLLDHLRRVIEGVSCSQEPDGKEQWWFGLGNDALISPPYSEPRPEERSQIDSARIWSFFAVLGIETKDRMGVPKSWKDVHSELHELFS